MSAGRPAPHVIAVRQDSAGDLLLMGPALRAIAAGASRLSLVCGPLGAPFAPMLPGVDRVLVQEAPWISPEPGELTSAKVAADVGELASLGASAAVVFTSFHQSPLPAAMLLRMAGVGTISAISVDYPGSLLDLRHLVPDDVHEVERALSLAAAAGFPPPAGDDARMRVELPPTASGRDGAGPPAPPAGPYVVVHPGASVPARAWRPEGFRRVVELLAGEGLGVVVTGGPSEAALSRFVAGPPRAGVVDAGGRTSPPALARLIAGAEAIVVANTGPAHLAAAVGTPVASLFAPTVPPVRWRPWMVPHELLSRPVPCAGCRARACPVEGHPCLDGIEAEEVVAAVRRLLAADRAPDPEDVGVAA